MILVNILIALWAALVAAGFILGTTFPQGNVPRITEFLRPYTLSAPNIPGLLEWAGRFIQPILSIVICLLLAFAARGAGRVVAGLLKFPRSERWWMAYAVGGALLSFTLFGLGLAGLLYQPLIFLLFAPICGFGMIGLPIPNRAKPPLPIWIVLSAGFLLLLWILGIMVPEPGIDAHLYHLRLPFYYLLHHRIYSVWHQIHGHVPQIWEFLLAIFPRNLSETGAQALSAFTAIAIWKMVLERQGDGWGIRAGLILLLSSPLIVATGTSAYSDLPLMWLEFGAFLLLIPSTGIPSKSALFGAGAILGLATSLKYASFPAFVAAAVVLIVMSVRRRSLTFIFFSSAGFLAVFWPWLAWNVLETGNPLFPFLGSVFPASISPLPFAERLSTAVFDRSAENICLSIWNGLIRCEPYLFITPILLASAPFIFLFNRRREDSGTSITWLLSFLVAWSVFMADERFILGVLPVWLLLLPRLDSFRMGKALFAVFVALNFLGGFRQILLPLDRLWAATGLISRVDYANRHIKPSPGYMNTVDWLNANTPENDCILFVSDFKSPYIWRECIHDHVYDYPTRLVYLLWKTPHNPERIAVRFRQLGIRWVVYLPSVNVQRLNKSPDLFPFDPEISRAWSGFWNKYAYACSFNPPVFIYGISGKAGPERDLYQLPGVEDAGMVTATDLLRSKGREAYIDYLRKLLKAYPRVGEFHRILGEVLMADPSTRQEGGSHIIRAEKSYLP